MLFKPEMIDALRNGSKTETRRVLKPGELLLADNIDNAVSPDQYIASYQNWTVDTVCHHGAYKWRVGRTYAIQPGYGNNGIGFFTMSFIRIERLHQITEAGAVAEGVSSLQEYQDLWVQINGRKGRYGWDSNPLVAVLGISDVKWNKEG